MSLIHKQQENLIKSVVFDKSVLKEAEKNLQKT